MSIFDKWNEQIDTAALVKEVKEVEANGGDYKEIPHGEYEVKIEKMELKESRKGSPMLSVMFRILEGEHKKSCLFMNQVVTSAFQIHLANDFLRSLDTGVNIDFNGSYSSYNDTILDVFEAIEKGKLEYSLAYGENKGYNTFKIKEVFES